MERHGNVKNSKYIYFRSLGRQHFFKNYSRLRRVLQEASETAYLPTVSIWISYSSSFFGPLAVVPGNELHHSMKLWNNILFLWYPSQYSSFYDPIVDKTLPLSDSSYHMEINLFRKLVLPNFPTCWKSEKRFLVHSEQYTNDSKSLSPTRAVFHLWNPADAILDYHTARRL